MKKLMIFTALITVLLSYGMEDKGTNNTIQDYNQWFALLTYHEKERLCGLIRYLAEGEYLLALDESNRTFLKNLCGNRAIFQSR